MPDWAKLAHGHYSVQAGLRVLPSKIFEFQTIAEIAGNLETSKEEETFSDEGWDAALNDMLKQLA